MPFNENAWSKLSSSQKEEVFKFAEDYKDFLRRVKTEREAVNYIESSALERGYSYSGNDLRIFKPSDKYIALFRKGKREITEGLKVIVSHIDSPHLDLKPQPIYEAHGIAFLDTQYYGGIKAYQWLSVPLAIHGYILDRNGRDMYIVIGEDENDPVFAIPDIEPHLSRNVQNSKTLKEAFKFEKLDVLFGSVPLDGEKEKPVKKYILKLLKEKYGITEHDFLSAEISIVPALKPRDVGLDGSMVGAYGQDDRICVFTSLKAMLDVSEPEYPLLVLFTDKEEIGSEGSTSAKSFYLKYIVKEILRLYALEPYMDEYVLMKSKAISADVTTAVNPLFSEVYDENNTAKLHHGIAISKYTGYGGKYMASEASAQFTNYILRLLDKHELFYQTGIIGKVDEGGGGTVSMFLAEYGMDIIDAGPPVLSMHSLFELSSKVDLYMTYRAYKVFLEDE